MRNALNSKSSLCFLSHLIPCRPGPLKLQHSLKGGIGPIKPHYLLTQLNTTKQGLSRKNHDDQMMAW